MSLWIFQVLVDIALLNVALMWLLSRKQNRFLQAQVDRLDHEVELLKSRARSASTVPTVQATAAQTAQISGHRTVTDSKSSEPSVGSLQSLSSAQASLATPPAIEAAKFVPALIPQNSDHLSRGSQSKFAGAGLVERDMKKSLVKSDPAEAFDRASSLLTRGVNLKEISSLTGLSLAELQLMNKIVSRNQ